MNAHQLTESEVDELAAAEAAAAEPAKQENLAGEPPKYVTLAYGAKGAKVTQLVNLLQVLGHATNDVIKGGEPILDESVLVDVRAAQQQLAILEPDPTTPAEIAVEVQGELVNAATWAALYEAVAGKLEAEAPAP